MELNLEAIKEHIKQKYRNNYTWFAEAIEVDESYFNQIINEKKPSNSNKVCNAIIIYCEKNNLNYKDYIFFK